MNYIVLLRSGSTKLVENVELVKGVDTLNEQGTPVAPEDVHRHMLLPMVLEEGATIRSALLMMAYNRVLCEVLSKDIKPFLDQAFGPEPEHDISGGIDPSDVEYAMLYRYAWRDAVEDGVELSGLECPSFCGVGRPLDKNIEECGTVIHEKGSRVHYGFSMTSVRHLLDIPLKLEPEVTFCPLGLILPTQTDLNGGGAQDDLKPRYERAAEVYQMPHFKLIEVLEGMMTELCYIGKS